MKNWLQNILQGIQDIYQILKEIKSLYNQITGVVVHLQTIIQLMEQHNQRLECRDKIIPESQEIKLLDVVAVMEILNISESTYYRWVDNGELEPRKKGKRHYYYLSDLRDQIAKGKLKGRL